MARDGKRLPHASSLSARGSRLSTRPRVVESGRDFEEETSILRLHHIFLKSHPFSAGVYDPNLNPVMSHLTSGNRNRTSESNNRTRLHLPLLRTYNYTFHLIWKRGDEHCPTGLKKYPHLSSRPDVFPRPHIVMMNPSSTRMLPRISLLLIVHMSGSSPM